MAAMFSFNLIIASVYSVSRFIVQSLRYDSNVLEFVEMIY